MAWLRITGHAFCLNWTGPQLYQLHKWYQLHPNGWCCSRRCLHTIARLLSSLCRVLVSAVLQVDAMAVALAAQALGAGRRAADDAVNPAVGVTALVKVGEAVAAGATLCVVHAASDDTLAEAMGMLAAGVRVEARDAAPSAAPLVAEVITMDVIRREGRPARVAV